MLKKLTVVLLSAFIVVLSVPFISSSATDVTVANTFGDITYGYTNDDFLTTVNYDTYYDSVDNGLKYSVNSDVFVNNNDSDYGSRMIETVLGNMSNLNNTEFPDVPGKHIGLYAWWRSTYSVYFYTLVVDGDDDIAFVNGNLCSKSPFTIKYYIYSCGSGTVNGTYTRYTGDGFGYNIIDDTANIQYDATNGIYYRVFGGMCVYSEVPYLFTYQNNSSYTDVNYLSQSPYEYQNWYNVYNAYVNNTDDTGFVIDRRTEKMINAEDEEDDIINDADLMDFKGELGFESFVFKSYIDKNADLVFPNYVINYKYNNYSDLRKENVLLYIDINFDFKITFNMAGGTVGYQSANMQNMSIEDITDNRNAYGGDINALIGQSRFINVRETSGLHLQSNDIVGYEDISDFTATSLIANLGRYFYKIMQNPSANHVVNSKRDSYFYIYLDFYLVDNTDGIYQESKHIKRRIDYWGDSSDPNSVLKSPAINDVDNSGIIDDDKAFQDFIDSYNSNNTSEDSGYINYLPSVNNGGSTSSVGNITINQNPYPYLLVDIPEGEWMSKTPNLTTILTDFKDALSEVKDNSILNVMSETYNYLPVPVWQYFTYGVGILIAIGIWRAITRR